MTTQTPPTNRAERRALKHKKGPSSPLWHSGKFISDRGMVLLNECAPYNPAETAHSHVVTRACFERLTDGSATEPDFDRVAMAINIAKYRAMEIDNDLALFLEQAQDAMTACKNRFITHGRFGFDSHGLHIMRQALDHHEAITDASTSRQLDLAKQQANRIIQKQLQNARRATK